MRDDPLPRQTEQQIRPLAWPVSLRSRASSRQHGCVYDVLQQSDERYIITSESSSPSREDLDFFATRLTTLGIQDLLGMPAFGTLGVQTVHFGAATDTALAYAIAPQSDGSLLMGGYTKPAAGKKNTALARVSGTDGSLDISFFSVGKRSFDLCGFAQDDEIHDIVIQSSDQKAVVTGTCSHNAAPPYNKDIFVARFNQDGTLDTTGFNSGGAVPGVLIIDVSSKDDEGNAIALQSNGKIIVAGYATIGTQEQFVVARITSAGALDASFGSSGIVLTPFGSGNARALTMALDVNSRILLGGYSTGTNSDFAFARYVP